MISSSHANYIFFKNSLSIVSSFAFITNDVTSWIPSTTVKSTCWLWIGPEFSFQHLHQRITTVWNLDSRGSVLMRSWIHLELKNACSYTHRHKNKHYFIIVYVFHESLKSHFNAKKMYKIIKVRYSVYLNAKFKFIGAVKNCL